LKEQDGKVSMLVGLYEEEYAKKVRHDLAFQNSFMLDKYLPENRIVNANYSQLPMRIGLLTNARRVSGVITTKAGPAKTL
jgi:hypothetical protein